MTTARTRRPAALTILPGLLTAWGPPAAPAVRADLPASESRPSVRDVAAAPFASELVASADGRVVAWVIDDGGVRNVWVARAPDWRGRAVTTQGAEDGQALSDVALSSDGRTLVYVRGGAPNRSGETPNPSSDTGGAEQALYAVETLGGAPRKLGEGHSPALSPSNDTVAFVKGGAVFTVPLDGSGEAKPLFKARGRASVLRWSPDGSRLAFVSDRETHGFIGVFDAAHDTLRWLDPGVDRDRGPAWSPDGRHVAFLREPADPDAYPFRPRREGPPFSIRVADAATGAGRLAWQARPGRGSVFREVVGPSVLWAAGDLLVFPWEAGGWTHLYAVPVAGGEPRLLTPGEGEVEHVALSPDGREVLFSSNRGDVDRRHVWRVGVAGGAPVAVTQGEGIEWEPAPVEGGVAVLRSDARKPARAALAARGGVRDVEGPRLPPAFPAQSLVVPQPVHFSAADGLRIPAQIFLPADLRPGEKRPAVVFFHGGSRRQMLLGWHYGQYYHYTYAFNQHLALRGYVVLSVNYRSGIGYGMEFREALDYGAAGASELADVLGAGLYLRSRPDVDPARIGLWGGSYGGYLTALGLARAPGLFAAGVDLHGVHDWNAVIRNFAPDYDPRTRRDAARVAFESSPLASVDSWRAPVLLVHGDDDRNVPFGETVALAAALRRRNVTVEELVFPDEVHSFLLHSRWVQAFERAAAFFDEHLRGPS